MFTKNNSEKINQSSLVEQMLVKHVDYAEVITIQNIT